MNKNVKGAIAVVIFVGLVFIAYKQVVPGKKRKVEYIVDHGYHSSVNTLLSFDDDYIDAWYKAAKAGSETFQVNGGTYRTKGGRATT